MKVTLEFVVMRPDLPVNAETSSRSVKNSAVVRVSTFERERNGFLRNTFAFNGEKRSVQDEPMSKSAATAVIKINGWRVIGTGGGSAICSLNTTGALGSARLELGFLANIRNSQYWSKVRVLQLEGLELRCDPTASTCALISS